MPGSVVRPQLAVFCTSINLSSHYGEMLSSFFLYTYHAMLETGLQCRRTAIGQQTSERN